jgi:hypothetical protein
MLQHFERSVVRNVSKCSFYVFRISDAVTVVTASTSPHDVPGRQTSLSVIDMEIIPVNSENHTEHTSTFRGQNEVVLMLKLVVLVVTCVS